jgi:thioredoxin 1
MPSSAVIPVDDQSFEPAVHGGPSRVLLDFTAERCAPCRALLPIVTRVAESSGDRLRVLKVDVDESPALAIRFGIRGIPTLVVLDDGRETGRLVGSATEARVRALIGAGGELPASCPR